MAPRGVNERLDRVEELLSRVAKGLEQLGGRQDQLVERVDEVGLKIGSEQQLEGLEERIVSATVRPEQLTRLEDELSKKAAMASEQLERLEPAIAEIAAAQERLAALLDERTAALEGIRGLEKKLDALAKARAARDGEVARALKEQSAGQQRQTERVTARQARAAKRIAELQDQLTALAPAIAELGSGIDRLHERAGNEHAALVRGFERDAGAREERLTQLSEQQRELGRASERYAANLENRIDQVAAEQRRLAATGEMLTTLRNSTEAGFERQQEALEQLAAKLEATVVEVADTSDRRRTTRAAEERLVRRRLEGKPDFKRFERVAADPVKSGRTLLGYDRLYVLWQLARSVAPLGLPAVEVGVYKGGSAYFLASAFRELSGKEADVHVIDTFVGHLEESLSPHDSAQHGPGHFGGVSYEDVVAYLGAFKRVVIHRGSAAKVMPSLNQPRYSLVHIDVDLYQPTLDALAYFGDRLASGGAIVVDDYGASKCPGVKAAVAEWSEGHEDLLTWYADTEQVVFIKAGERSRKGSNGGKRQAKARPAASSRRGSDSTSGDGSATPARRSNSSPSAGGNDKKAPPNAATRASRPVKASQTADAKPAAAKKPAKGGAKPAAKAGARDESAAERKRQSPSQ